MAAIIKDLGVGYSTLDKWMCQTSETGSSKLQLSSKQQKILELEKEIRKLKEANDILKMAHVYFQLEDAKKSTR